MRDIEVFNLISNRLVEATMMHSELGDLFAYLGLDGFVKTQDYQFVSENYDRNLVNRYAIFNLGYVINNDGVRGSKYIPGELNGVARLDVNSLDKKDMTRYAVETWVNWETETKELYGNWYINLCDNHSISSSLFVDNLVKGVDDELKRASNILVELKNVNFEMRDIVLMQEKYKRDYDKMLRKKLKEFAKKGDTHNDR